MRVGTAIGGVLVAVLVVYAIVPTKAPTKDKSKAPVVLKTGNGAVAIPETTGGAPDNAGGAGASNDSGSAGGPPAGSPNGGSTDTPAGGNSANTGASGTTTDAPAGSHDDQSPAAPAAPIAGHPPTDWRTILGADIVDDSPSHSDSPGSTGVSDGAGTSSGLSTRNTSGGASPGAINRDPAPDNQAAHPPIENAGAHSGAGTAGAAGSKTHKIAAGETFSSIAKSVYGDARYYKQIASANPTVNPARLRPGATIQLPDRSTFSTPASTHSTGATTASGAIHASPSAARPAIDSHSEYRIQGNDSLYKISMKLYNTPNRVEQIYQLNKDRIGTDPAKLKVNMILRLPVPPTQTASR
ncbi:MAG TPA: LysM peptidoglycan-binding domain-containing protein [Tepidisphaeraceae bacterium]|nr:LysM peptidoglycan-binding domain-containing protein [Tepidisphaeraceae bacterium]